MHILRSRAKLLSVFLVLFLACAFLPTSSLAFEEFEDKDKLMDELDRLKTFTETRIKNKETVLQAKKDAWDREEKLDKSLDGLELEDKLEKQFEADLEQVQELGLVGNRRMLQ
jgi:predicted outer membrane lipoprotein